MKTNTKKFLTLINKVKEAGKETNLNNIVEGLKDVFLIDDPINIDYTKKNLKPLDLKAVENETNILYFITALKQKDSNNNYYYNFYCYEYNDGKITEANIFNFTNYSYKTNAENRKNAVYTILIYQNSKYMQEANKKRENRKQQKEEKDPRYILKKSNFNKYADPENQQRYKYIKAGADPKKNNNIYVDNLTQKEIYNFKKYNYNYYYNNSVEIAMDKSGYILTEKRADLKQRALKLKEDRALESFNNYKKDFYIKALEEDRRVLEAQTLEAYKKASNTGLESIKNMNLLYNESIKDILNDLNRYINKLKNNEFSNGWCNPGVVKFENTLIDLHKDYYNYIYEIAFNYNKFLNFDILCDEIEKAVGGFSSYESFLKENGIEWTAPANLYKDYKDKIKNENGYISFLGYKKQFKNYYWWLKICF